MRIKKRREKKSRREDVGDVTFALMRSILRGQNIEKIYLTDENRVPASNRIHLVCPFLFSSSVKFLIHQQFKQLFNLAVLYKCIGDI